ncbi:hypothetical protein COEX109129_40430 [Corallococcus exiguus]
MVRSTSARACCSLRRAVNGPVPDAAASSLEKAPRAMAAAFGSVKVSS